MTTPHDRIARRRVERWRLAALHGPRWRRRRAVRRLTATAGPDAAGALARVLAAADDDVRSAAAAALTSLTAQDEIDAVCEVAIDTDDAQVCEVVRHAGHEPSDPRRRALWLFLDEQYDRCARLDFDGALLGAVFRDADAALRRRLADRARAAGRLEWVRAVAGDPRTHRLLTDAEWSTTLRVLADARRFDDLWQRLPTAPLPWVERILTELGRHRWLPAEPDRAAYQGLLERAQACRMPLSARARFADREVLFRRAGDGHVRIVAAGPRGDRLVTGDSNWPFGAALQVWDLSSGELAGALAGSGRYPNSCHAVTGDGTTFVEGGNNVLQKWDLGTLFLTGTVTLPTRLTTPVRSVVAADDTLIAVASDGAVYQWDLVSGVLARRCRTGARGHTRLAVTPDGTLLAVAARDDGAAPDRRGPGRVWLYHLPSWTPAAVLDADRSWVSQMVITSDGRHLVTVGYDYVARSWSLPSGAAVGYLHGPCPGSLRMLPDGRLLITNFLYSSRHEGLTFWSVPGLEPAGKFRGFWSHDPGALFSPDGTLFVCRTGGDDIGLSLLPAGTDLGTLGARYVRAGELLVTTGNLIIAVTGERKDYWDVRGQEELVLWRPREELVGPRPAAGVTPSELAALRAAVETTGRAQDRPWLDLLEALVLWRHQHDIAVSSGEPVTRPGETDIEVDR